MDYNYKICDELSYGYIQAFELPLELERMAAEARATATDGLVTKMRPLTQYEVKAFGIEDPESTFAIVAYNAEKGSLFPTIVDNSTGDYDSVFYGQIDVPLMLAEQDEMTLSNNQSKEDSPLGVGAGFATCVAACQSREGYEFDDFCLSVTNLLKMNLTIPGEVRRIVHCGLLQPESDLDVMAVEIERAIRDESYVSEEFTSNEIEKHVLAELLYIINDNDLTVDKDAAVRWINFCCTRSVYYTAPGASQQFALEYEPIFADIDEALGNHQLFSALIYGPEDWAKPIK